MTSWYSLPKFYVYCHTNKINGKKYVGWTSLTVSQRWEHHCTESRRNKKKKARFHRAIKKWGQDNWAHEILDVLTSDVSARHAEKLWIAELKTFAYDEGNLGYNETRGGDGLLGRRHSEETRKKLASYCGENHHGFGKPSPNLGNKASDETKRKMSESRTGLKRDGLHCLRQTLRQAGTVRGPNRGRGKPSKLRGRSSILKGKNIICSMCGEPGHNKRTCNYIPPVLRLPEDFL